MKFQCPCGAKYAFDIAPEMVQNPVKFVCQNCGQDSSAFVNEYIRSQFPPAAVPVSAPPPTVPPLTPAAPLRSSAPMRVQSPVPAGVTAAPAATSGPPCPKHIGQHAVGNCVVCSKPICHVCMKLFGYVCSPMCRQKADLSGIEIPEYEFQNSVQSRKHQRKLMMTIGSAVGVAALIVSVWLWYLLIGSRPQQKYSARFAQAATSGKIHLVGKDQIIFIHGSKLARHDISAKKELWSVSLVDHAKIAEEARLNLKQIEEGIRRDKLAGENTDRYKIPTLEKLTAELEKQYVADIDLHVRGEKIWVAQADKLVRHDWADGKVEQEVPVSFGFGGAEIRGDDLLALREDYTGNGTLTKLNLATGSVSTENFQSSRAANSAASQIARALNVKGGSTGAGALDPDRVAAQAQRLSLGGRLALPATISIQQGQNRLNQEMDEMDSGPARGSSFDSDEKPDMSEHATTIATTNGPVEFSRQMLEHRIVVRSAVKAPPKKSALDGPVNANATMDVANEILNEITRTQGSDTVKENHSLYRVIVRMPGKAGAAEWKNEMSGEPDFHPLTTVNLVIAGTNVCALDKNNRQVWQHTLSHPVPEGEEFMRHQHGDIGTIAEHNSVVFIADKGVLTALDAATGNVRWRFPTVGVSGLFFDSAGKLYVNSTTADPETIQFSRQIDVGKIVNSLIVKLDPATGKTLWRVEARGKITHVTGKFLYTMESTAPDDNEDADEILGQKPSAHPGSLSIRRIRASNGGTEWEYEQERGPLDVEIIGNSIQIIYPTEVEVLRFLSF